MATVPFTLRNFKDDLEFRLASEALELERSGLGYQRVPPGSA